jgi:hypothetical protein
MGVRGELLHITSPVFSHARVTAQMMSCHAPCQKVAP